MGNKHQLFFKTRSEFRKWLETNHDSADSFDMLFYKKHTQKPCIVYDDAVEEALCFGWIDGKLKRLDADRFIRRFSPRTPKSAWSDRNVKRMEKMIEGKKAIPEAIALFLAAKRNDFNRKKAESDFSSPPEALLNKLKDDPEAECAFQALTAREKTAYNQFIGEAKQDKTKQKRLDEMIWKLKEGWRMPYHRPKVNK